MAKKLIQVWFGGEEITKYCDMTLGLDTMMLPSREDTTVSPGNRAGAMLQQAHWGIRTITTPFVISGGDLTEKAKEMSRILYSDTVKKLVFSDKPDRYWTAIPNGGIEIPYDDVEYLAGEIKWLCYDPYAYSMREDEFKFNDKAETADITLDLSGKVFGDLNSNPNSIWGAEWKEIESRPPSSFWWEWEQSNYAKVTKQDGVSGSYTRPDSKEHRQAMIDNDSFNPTCLMMKFDILNGINKAYPGFWSKYGLIDKNTKLDWLKDNLQSFEFDVWSYGVGASGYGVKVQYWNGSEWVGIQNNKSKTPTKNSYTFTKAEEIISYLDADGYFYALTGTNDADATHDSTTWMDYTCIKLSVALPVTDAINVVNDGPLPVPIRFELTNHGDNGFFGITNDTESILIGKPSDIDGGFVENSERLFTTNQNNSNGLKQWTINKGVLNDWNEEAVQIGTFEDPSVIKESRWRLRNGQDMQTSWGNGAADGRGWHGPSASAKFAKDSKGATGALNFTARFYVQYLFGNMNQSGLQQTNLVGSDGKLLVSVQMWKDVGKHSGFSIRIGDQSAWTDNNNARWDNFFGSILIKRHGNQYTIELENIEGSGPKTRQTITYDDADSAKIPATQVTYWKARWGNEKNYNQVMYNDFYDFWFQKDNVDHYVDIPNTFSDLDTVVIDGSNRKVTTKVNGTLNLGLQDVGSQPILAYPGKNMINIMYSDFANRPDVKAYIRKRYL